MRTPRENKEKVTIVEVARDAKVSVATVSRVLNNPHSVRKEKRDRVLSVVESSGYRPHMYAKRLAGGRLNIYGLIIPGYEGIFYSFYALEILRSIGVALENKNVDILLHIFWKEDKFNFSLIEGVIFADVIGNRLQLEKALAEKIPTVVVNRIVDDLPVSSVAVDNFKGGKEATEFLIYLGHKKIAHITGDLNTQCATQRMEGFKKACSDAKIEVPKDYLRIGNFSRLSARGAAEALFSLDDIPSAVFVASDDMASEVINFLFERGLQVPEDVSIIGFDDNPYANAIPMNLTTVKQPFEEMVRRAINLLEEIVTGQRKSDAVEQILVPPSLIIRDTTSYVKK